MNLEAPLLQAPVPQAIYCLNLISHSHNEVIRSIITKCGKIYQK